MEHPSSLSRHKDHEDDVENELLEQSAIQESDIQESDIQGSVNPGAIHRNFMQGDETMRHDCTLQQGSSVGDETQDRGCDIKENILGDEVCHSKYRKSSFSGEITLLTSAV